MGEIEKIDLDVINSMDGHLFENLITELLRKMGFVVEQTKKTGDGGIDMNAYSDKPIISGRYIIQCKRFSTPISEPIIRDLYGVMTAEKANKGILITNSTFTSASIAFAENKPIELIHGTKLVDLFIQYLDLNQIRTERMFSTSNRLLLSETAKIFPKIKEEYKAIKAGLVFQNKRDFSQIAINDYFCQVLQTQIDNISSFSEVMNNFQSHFNELFSDNNENSFANIKNSITRFEEFLQSFFSGWKKFYFTNPPKRCQALCEAYLSIYDSLFTSLFSWASTLEDTLKNPKKYSSDDGRITLSFEFPSLEETSEIISSEVAAIKGEMARPSKSGCFIATACYGASSHEVAALRLFRDNVLLQNNTGRLAVAFYYKVSPSMANMLSRNDVARQLCRGLLQPIIFFAKKACSNQKSSRWANG